MAADSRGFILERSSRYKPLIISRVFQENALRVIIDIRRPTNDDAHNTKKKESSIIPINYLTPIANTNQGQGHLPHAETYFFMKRRRGRRRGRRRLQTRSQLRRGRSRGRRGLQNRIRQRRRHHSRRLGFPSPPSSRRSGGRWRIRLWSPGPHMSYLNRFNTCFSGLEWVESGSLSQGDLRRPRRCSRFPSLIRPLRRRTRGRDVWIPRRTPEPGNVSRAVVRRRDRRRGEGLIRKGEE